MNFRDIKLNINNSIDDIYLRINSDAKKINNTDGIYGLFKHEINKLNAYETAIQNELISKISLEAIKIHDTEKVEKIQEFIKNSKPVFTPIEIDEKKLTVEYKKQIEERKIIINNQQDNTMCDLLLIVAGGGTGALLGKSIGHAVIGGIGGTMAGIAGAFILSSTKEKGKDKKFKIEKTEKNVIKLNKKYIEFVIKQREEEIKALFNGYIDNIESKYINL